MRVAGILALCLLAGTATAYDFGNITCGPQGLMGGWQPVDATTLNATLLDEIFGDYVERYGSNVTDILATMLPGYMPCDKDDGLELSASGCSQVVNGINYKLLVNATCTLSNGSTVTVGMTTDAALVGDAYEVYDVDVEFLAVDGKVMDDDFDSFDAADKFDDIDGDDMDDDDRFDVDDSWNSDFDFDGDDHDDILGDDRDGDDNDGLMGDDNDRDDSGPMGDNDLDDDSLMGDDNDADDLNGQDD